MKIHYENNNKIQFQLLPTDIGKTDITFPVNDFIW